MVLENCWRVGRRDGALHMMASGNSTRDLSTAMLVTSRRPMVQGICQGAKPGNR